MSVLLWTCDVLLAVALLWLAWQSLATKYLFKSIILFIVFGLLMALVWARLEAPDIAVAEAAIGAGVTGALFLSTFRDLGGEPARNRDASS